MLVERISIGILRSRMLIRLTDDDGKRKSPYRELCVPHFNDNDTECECDRCERR
jgi:hypothetical protein